jgi:transposase InsO family protein
VKLGGGKEWFTAKELEELALPGLRISKRKINERAAAECWALREDAEGNALARSRIGVRGGGLEYHLSVLPAAARAGLAAMGVGAVATVSAEPESRAAALWRWYEGQTDKVRADAEYRLGVLASVELFMEAGMTGTAAIGAVAGRENISASSIRDWQSKVRGVAAGDRLPYLAQQHAGGNREVEVDPEAWQLLLSDFLRLSKPSFSSCYQRVLTEFCKPRGIKLPIERTLRRKFEREVDPIVVIARRQGQEALRRSLPAQQRTVAGEHAMSLVNIDGHRWDVFVKWPDGTVARPVMVAIQDVFSRKFLSWSIGRTESAVETRLAIAHMLERYGVPNGILLDNGRAFASKWITGGAPSRFRFKIREDEPLGVLTMLEVKNHWAKPYRGQSKPIERMFKDFCDAIAKHPAFEGAYTGNKPDAKPENYGTKAVPLARFIEVAEAGFAAHNARPGRRTEMARDAGLSFDQVFDQSYAVSQIRKATEEHRRLALLTADDRPTDRKTGTITMFGNRYWTEQLGQIAGEKVTVRFDPDDLHAPLHVYDRKGRYLCSAPVLEATGFLDVAAAKRRGKLEQDYRRATKAKELAMDLLDADRVADLYTPPEAIDTLPPAGAVRPVRVRGNTAAALKTTAQRAPSAATEAARGAALDQLVAGSKRLRIVK